MKISIMIQKDDPSQITLERWERFCFGVKGAGLLPGQEVKVYTFDGGQLQNGNVAPDGCFELTLPNHAGLLIIHSGTLVKKVMIK